MDEKAKRLELLKLYHGDRRLAHAVLFSHRHKNKTPDFAALLIDSLHAPDRKRMDVAFRGAMKTTTAEEAVILGAGFREIHNCLILGANEKLAQKVLHAIRREIERNGKLRSVFGDLRGRPWADDILELSNGCTIAALGKGQSMRGIKDGEFRPDFILGTDLESKEDVRGEDGREKLQSWLLGEVIPAMDPQGRVRIQANVMHEMSLSEVLARAGSGFECQRIPWIYKDLATGQRMASWPDRYPLEFCDAECNSMYAAGRAKEYLMEYMCEASPDRAKTFTEDMKRVEPRARVWEAVYVMCDPARTTGKQSATTGWAAWSWIGPRLHFWHLSAVKMMPDEVIRRLLELNATYHPVKVGFEADGLNEWALQPIRMAMVGSMMPLVPVKAPAGKLDFIRGLQIYFQAREVWFSEEFPEAWAQFRSFPAGLIDAPNAAAYALHRDMKPGQAIYLDFNGVVHVVDDLRVDHGRPSWLGLNATRSHVTAVLVQYDGERLRVLDDWTREGEAAEVMAPILREANLVAGKRVNIVVGPRHLDRYNNVGLVQAVARAHAECQGGTVPDAGRDELRNLLKRMPRAVPAVAISGDARWTLNGFAGGYCRSVLKGGMLAEVAEEGVYKTLMEGLESMVGLLRTEDIEGDETGRNYETIGGQRYITSMPRRQ